ncbi:hypothetical protein IMZ48_32105 [Candidatus Bathyarchaeota archaeon]|nr:hypothetical protein [Candidatus Bathyarchaeota archaeon]
MLEIVSYSGDIFTSAMELFSELLSSHHGFLTAQHIAMLLEFCRAPLASEHYGLLLQGDDSVECVQLGLFLLALGEYRVDSLLSETHDSSSSHHLLEQLCGLLTAKGYPVVEDRIFVPAVEFWSTVIETVAEDVFSGDDGGESQSAQHLKQYAGRAVHSAFSKITFPSPDVFSEWDSADREGFIDARKDVADLLQAMHSISGRDLVARFTSLILQAMASAHWVDLEAAAFCLGSLAECVARSPTYDELLAAVFSPEFFGMLRSSEVSVPMRTRQSCIALIEKYADYFERNTSSLPNALNLLFSVMDDSLLGGPASKSILRLCRSCRPALASEASTFVAEYRTIATQRQVDCLANERIVGAIGAVIQAIDDEGAQVTVLHQLLDVLFGDAEACLLAIGNARAGLVAEDPRLYRCGSRCLADVPPEEILLHTSIRVLRCLIAIGKGLQAPAEVPVDIDSPENERAGNGNSGTLGSVHLRIITVITELQKAFPGSGEVVEAICSIFRAGFTESTPGPFVFPPDVVGSYLMQHGLSTPRIGALVSAACTFVSSSSPKTQGWQGIMTSLMNWVIGLIHELPGTKSLALQISQLLTAPAVDADPELSQNGIDFVCRLLVKDPGVPLQPQQRESLVSFFRFTLRVLDGQEPLPKATAAEFWVSRTAMPLLDYVPVGCR